MAEPLVQRIILDPGVMSGKPVIKGTRLTVQFILGLLAHGATVDEILEEHEGLTEDDVRASSLPRKASSASSCVVPVKRLPRRSLSGVDRFGAGIVGPTGPIRP